MAVVYHHACPPFFIAKQDGWIDELQIWSVARTAAETCADLGGSDGRFMLPDVSAADEARCRKPRSTSVAP